MLKGNHLFTFGGAYQRNWDWHQRSDNGGGINYQATYQLGDSAGGGLVNFSATNPAGVSYNYLGSRRLPPFWASSRTHKSPTLALAPIWR